MMASSLGAAGRLAPQQCARTALSNKRQRRSAAARLARRQNVTVAAEGNGSNGNLAWDTLSVDELQEWEVGGCLCLGPPVCLPAVAAPGASVRRACWPALTSPHPPCYGCAGDWPPHPAA